MIREKRIRRGDVTLVEFIRDGADTVYVLTPSAAEACASIRNQDARWKCLKAACFAHRKRRPEDR